MAATSLRPCLTCGRPAPGAYCDEHAKPYQYGGAWPIVRRLVLARDEARCRIRALGCTGKATTVHRLPEYGLDHDANLHAYVSACRHCHGVVDAPRSKQPRS